MAVYDLSMFQNDEDCQKYGVTVAWHGKPVGKLDCSGNSFEWYAPEYEQAFSSYTPGMVPASLQNLRAEGWLAEVLGDRSPEEYRAEGRHFLSNLFVAMAKDQQKFLDAIHEDILTTKLQKFTDESGVFTGEYKGPDGGGIIRKFEQQMAATALQPISPRMSGRQVKMPMTLQEDGSLIPAINTSFTHILKPSGSPKDCLDYAGATEWAGLELAKAAGLPTAGHALVPMPQGLPPALLVERFDIPTAEQAGKVMILAQDFCSASRKDPEDRVDGTMEQCGKIVRKMCSDPDEASEKLFQRTAVAWLMRDNDMHLKNLSLLKTMEVGKPETLRTQFAPAYDAMTTTIFPNSGRDQLILKIGQHAQQTHLSPRQFYEFADSMSISKDRAREILFDTAERMAARAVAIAEDPPSPIKDHPRSLFAIKRIASEVVTRAKEIGAVVPEFETVPAPKWTKEERLLRQRSFFAMDPTPTAA